MDFTLSATQDDDKFILADIRVEAMRPSLELLERFDETRVRNRLIDDFDAPNTQNIIVDGQIVGFFCLQDKTETLWLKHLYFLNKCQGKGLGQAIIKHIKTIAARQNKPIKLQALRNSPANKFYQNCGFAETHQEQWDIFYKWPADI